MIERINRSTTCLENATRISTPMMLKMSLEYMTITTKLATRGFFHRTKNRLVDYLIASFNRFQRVQSRPCKSDTICRPVHGEWGTWNGWTDCSKTCGYGLRATMRYCNSPFPSRHPRGRPCPFTKKKVADLSESGVDDSVQYEFKEEKCILDECRETHYEHRFRRDHVKRFQSKFVAV